MNKNTTDITLSAYFNDIVIGYYEDEDLVKQFGVTQAPTLIVTSSEGFTKYAGAGAIRKYLMDRGTL